MRQGRGGRPHQFNIYWYRRLYAIIAGYSPQDHRALAAMRRTKYNRTVDYTIDNGTLSARQNSAEYIGQ